MKLSIMMSSLLLIRLLQKDIEFYKTIPFGYAILDEASILKIEEHAMRNR